MSPLEAVAVLLAGLAAGTVNAIVGAGTLITFPVLLAVGYPAVLANVSNTLGLVPGALSGAIGYRRELAGQRRRALVLSPLSITGGFTGAVLLLALPNSVFDGVVPLLILTGCVLIAIQPKVSSWLAARQPGRERIGPALMAGVFATGVYGGYFGAAQGVILIALLGIFLPDDLQRLNGLKNLLGVLVNGVAAIVFLFTTEIAWEVVGLIASGSIVGGQAGAYLGRRMSGKVLRAVIVVVGVLVAVRLLVG